MVATDTAGNSSEQAVSLAINNLDDTPPTVNAVAITSATGEQNNTLNAGDTVTVTATMSENTNVDVTGGTPHVALNIGASTVFANYFSGDGTTSLVFHYTVQPGNTDANGISIPANAFTANGGSLTDTAGNVAVLSHGAVADNASYLVDTIAPALSSSTPLDGAANVAVGNNIVLNFNENVVAGSGNITISDGTDTRTIGVTDGSQVDHQRLDRHHQPHTGTCITAVHTSVKSTAARSRTRRAMPTLASATPRRSISIPVDTSVVVFDLLDGTSSSHSSRTFDAGTSYTIYILVDSNTATLNPATAWSGAGNLGSDDKIVLVGNGTAVHGPTGPVIAFGHNATGISWNTSPGAAATAALLQNDGHFYRYTGSVQTVGTLGRQLGRESRCGQHAWLDRCI